MENIQGVYLNIRIYDSYANKKGLCGMEMRFDNRKIYSLYIGEVIFKNSSIGSNL